MVSVGMSIPSYLKLIKGRCNNVVCDIIETSLCGKKLLGGVQSYIHRTWQVVHRTNDLLVVFEINKCG
jgi:hypothetical protein